MRESGVLDKIISKWMPDNGQNHVTCQVPKLDLGYNELLGVFLLLCLGIFCSICLLFLEGIYTIIFKKKKSLIAAGNYREEIVKAVESIEELMALLEKQQHGPALQLKIANMKLLAKTFHPRNAQR